MSTPPKIAVIYNCVPHYREAFFRELSNSTEMDVSILADDTTDTKHMAVVTSESPKGIKLQLIQTRSVRFLGKKFFLQPGLLRTLRHQRFDLIVPLGNPNILSTWVLMLWARLYRTPVLLWTHGTLEVETGLKRWARIVYYRLSSGLLLYGDHAVDLLGKMGLRNPPMFPIYNSLDYEQQKSIREHISQADLDAFRLQLGILKSSHILIFTGRLQPVKQLDKLIQLASALNQRNVDTHCLLIGDGDERSNLESLASSLGIEGKTHFLGPIYDESTLGLAISCADLYVVPSGAGLAIMHSLAYGTPVLLHDDTTQHFPEWEAAVRDKNAIYYQQGNLSDMISKAERYLRDGQPNISRADCYQAIEKNYTPKRQYELFLAAAKHVMRRP